MWPYSRVRSRYCPSGLFTSGRDMRGASPPLDWPIMLLLRRDTASMGLCRRWAEGQVGLERRQEEEECCFFFSSFEQQWQTPSHQQHTEPITTTSGRLRTKHSNHFRSSQLTNTHQLPTDKPALNVTSNECEWMKWICCDSFHSQWGWNKKKCLSSLSVSWRVVRSSHESQIPNRSSIRNPSYTCVYMCM